MYHTWEWYNKYIYTCVIISTLCNYINWKLMKFHHALPLQPWILLAMHNALIRLANQNVHVCLFAKLGQSPHLTAHLHYLPHKAIWIRHLESQLFVQKIKNLPSWATKPIIKFICSLSMTDDNIQHWYLHFAGHAARDMYNEQQTCCIGSVQVHYIYT